MNKKIITMAVLVASTIFMSSCSKTPGTIGVEESGGFNLEESINSGSLGIVDEQLPDWVYNPGTGTSTGDWLLGDLDNDGIPNFEDLDMDGDGIDNVDDPDMDGNGVDDVDQVEAPPEVGTPENPLPTIVEETDPDAVRGQAVTITKSGDATMKIQTTLGFYSGSDGLELEEIRDTVSSNGGDPSTVTVADEGVVLSAIASDPVDATRLCKVIGYIQYTGGEKIQILESASGTTVADLGTDKLILSKNLVKSGDGSAFDDFIKDLNTTDNAYADFIIEVQLLDNLPLTNVTDFDMHFDLIVNAKGNFI